MNRWTEIRLAVLSGQLSISKAAEKYGLNWRTIRKTLDHVEPPSYCRKVDRPKRTLGPFIPIIHEILESDKSKPKKQRHTGKRVFERLCKEHGYCQGSREVCVDRLNTLESLGFTRYEFTLRFTGFDGNPIETIEDCDCDS